MKFDLNIVIFNNTLRAYLIAFISLFLFIAVIKIYSLLLSKRLKRIAAQTSTNVDDIIIDILDRAIVPVLFAASLNVLPQFLTLPVFLSKLFHLIFIVIITYYAITSLIRFIDSVIADILEKKGHVEAHASNVLKVLSKIVLWVIGLLLVIKNLGYDITSALTGVGIAGVAVALAVQNILGDLFSYISILIDKPFEKGDFIIIGAEKGTIENIGLRSTRIRSLDGQEIIVPNADLTSSRINNYKRMERRRAAFTIGVTYSTPIEKLRAIPEWIREIISTIKNLTLDRVNFIAFGNSSLDFEIVYFIPSSDYNVYIDIQEKINLAIIEKFKIEGVEFAFPTQTIIFEKSKDEAVNKRKDL